MLFGIMFLVTFHALLNFIFILLFPMQQCLVSDVVA
jgi:hypothetical protein